jgi:hypothetical protein
MSLPLIGAVPFSMSPRPSITQDMAMLNAIEAQLVRVEVSWAETEAVKGTYAIPDYAEGRIAAARAAGCTVIVLLDYGHPLYTGSVFTPPTTAAQLQAYANFCAWVAQQYTGPKYWFEVYNEPNNPTFWGGAPSSAQYAALLNAAVPAIKSKNATAQIMTAGVGDLPAPGIDAVPFMQAVMPLLTAGAKVGLSAHALHPYNPGKPETLFGYIDAYKAAIGNVPIMLTEWGYPNAWTNSDRVVRANYAARMVGCAIFAGVLGLTFYNLRDTGADLNNIENSFGLHTYSLVPKLAVTAISSMMDAMTSSYEVIADRVGSAYRITFYEPEGSVTKVLWTDVDLLNHVEPMASVTSIKDANGGVPATRFNGETVSVQLGNALPVVIIKGKE